MSIALPPSQQISSGQGAATFEFWALLRRLVAAVNAVSLNGFPRAPVYTVATLPSASTATAGALVYVSNETGGAVLAFSDGTNWLRVTDRATVS